MSHLKCIDHGRRASVTSSGKVIHRGKDSQPCDTRRLRQGDTLLLPAEVIAYANGTPVKEVGAAA